MLASMRGTRSRIACTLSVTFSAASAVTAAATSLAWGFRSSAVTLSSAEPNISPMGSCVKPLRGQPLPRCASTRPVAN